LEGGTVLLEETPVVFAIHLKLWNYCCRGCLQCDVGNPEPLRLACECGVRYCSAACQKKDAQIHEQICGTLNRYRQLRPYLASRKYSLEDVIFIQSLVAMWQQREAGVLQLSEGQKRRESTDAEVFDLCQAVIEEEVDTALWEQLAGIEQNNAMGVFSVFKEAAGALELGRALLLLGSRFNHHCCPNVARVRRGKAMAFVTIRAIAKDEEMCISYLQLDAADKHATLKRDYGFECKCKGGGENEWCKQCGGELIKGRCVHHRPDDILKGKI
jgi:hypothetical protein